MADPGNWFKASRRLFREAKWDEGPYSNREAWLYVLAEMGYPGGDTEPGTVHLPTNALVRKFRWSKPRVIRWRRKLVDQGDLVPIESDTPRDTPDETTYRVAGYDTYYDGDTPLDTPERYPIPRSTTKTNPLMSDEIEQVFAHWVEVRGTVFGRTSAVQLTPKRRDLIRARLRDGYSVAQLRDAIDAASQTAWVRERAVSHFDFHHVFRPINIDRYVEIGAALDGSAALRPAERTLTARERMEREQQRLRALDGDPQ